MKSVKIAISGEIFDLRQSFRSLIEFEKMTGKNSFQADASITDSLNIFYCMLKAANVGRFNFSFDQFLSEIDKDPAVMSGFNDFMVSLLSPSEEVETASVEKKTELR